MLRSLKTFIQSFKVFLMIFAFSLLDEQTKDLWKFFVGLYKDLLNLQVLTIKSLWQSL